MTFPQHPCSSAPSHLCIEWCRTLIITANGVIEAPLITVERIRWGELEAGAVEVVCHDIPELAGIEGLLGLSFLQHFRTLIDYTTGVLKITAGR